MAPPASHATKQWRAGKGALLLEPVDVRERRQLDTRGWTTIEIAQEIGDHPATLNTYVPLGGVARTSTGARESESDAPSRQARILSLIGDFPRPSEVSVHSRSEAGAFEGRYSMATRVHREMLDPRFEAAG